MTIRIVVRPDEDDVVRFIHNGETVEVTVDQTPRVQAAQPLSASSVVGLSGARRMERTVLTPNTDPENMPSTPSERPRDESNPWNVPPTRSTGDGSNPWIVPHPRFVPEEHSTPPMDSGAIVADLLRHFEDKNKPDPGGLILRGQSFDLSNIIDLSRKIEKIKPDLPIGLDFGSKL